MLRAAATLLALLLGALPAQDHPRSCSVALWTRVVVAQDGFPLLAGSKPWRSEPVVDFTSHHNLGRAPESGVEPGWALALQPDGSWLWNIGDGKARLDYLPTAARQPVADGTWHHLACVLDHAAGTAQLYHDGREVARYDLAGLADLPLAPIQQPRAPGIEVADLLFERAPRDAAWVRQHRGRRDAPPRAPPPRLEGDELRVLAWNIWHGGRRDGEQAGLRRVVETIRSCGADVVAMQETYGSGPRIADALGWSFYLRSSNISVLSRFPILATHRPYQPFRCGGVTLDLGGGRRAKVFSLWIHHLPDYGKAARDGASAAELVAAEGETRAAEIAAILRDLEPHTAAADQVPVVVAGDFNSPSHLDWVAATRARNHDRVVRWPVSLAMARAGYRDGFRTAHPDPAARPGRTWSPRFTETRQDRIDYVYLAGEGVHTRDAAMLDQHAEGWPSDHAAVLATLVLQPRHETRVVEGFTLRVGRNLLAEQQLARATLAEVTRQLRAVVAAVPAPALAHLREVPIFVHARSATRCMAYHPSRRYLVDHGFDPAMARAVEVGNAGTFLDWVDTQPWMVLHELAHAYHDRVLGFDHAPLRGAFARPETAERYALVRHADGRRRRHYALTDHKEWFAELSEALFGRNDFFPFTRAELATHDPEGLEVVRAAWGAPRH